jgi:hypothetical protein
VLPGDRTTRRCLVALDDYSAASVATAASSGRLLRLLASGENVAEPISDSTRRQPDARCTFTALRTTTYREDGNAVHFGVLLFGEDAIEFDARGERNRLLKFGIDGSTGHALVPHQQ